MRAAPPASVAPGGTWFDAVTEPGRMPHVPGAVTHPSAAHPTVGTWTSQAGTGVLDP
ncbi:hypothetical protein DFQ13_10797 [Actinokineospora spheciospongiae]|nr:hypothetical protein DFQ13_10797 [Actinokineospora spheciospongiae]